MTVSTVHLSFPPVADPDIRILILGSMPGARSLEMQQYYAHPRNQFWRIMDALAGESISSLPYTDRCAALLAKGIGLWDVLKSCTREGSLDAAIRDAEPNDLAGFLAAHPRLRAVGFNGGTAAKVGRRLLSEGDTLRLHDLPSSSPAYTLPFKTKTERWSAALRCAVN